MPSPGTRRRKRRGGRPRPSEPRTRGGCIRPRAGPGSFICRFTTALVKRHNGSISFGVPVTGGNRPPDSAWHAGSHTVFGLPPAAAYSVGAIALEASWILARRLPVQMPEAEDAAYCTHGDSRLAQGRFGRKGGSDEATETPRRIGCEGHLRRRDSVDSGQSGWSEAAIVITSLIERPCRRQVQDVGSGEAGGRARASHVPGAAASARARARGLLYAGSPQRSSNGTTVQSVSGSR